jgi:hypothetical protein
MLGILIPAIIFITIYLLVDKENEPGVITKFKNRYF